MEYRTRVRTIIIECSNGALERRQFINSTLAELMFKSLQSENDSEWTFATVAASPRRAFDAFQEENICLPNAITSIVRKNAANLIQTRAQKDARYARLKYEWYAKVDKEEFDRYGLEIPYATPHNF